MIQTSAEFHPQKGTVPTHIGLIPDGCGRWARGRGISLREGYDHAMQNLCTLIEYVFSREIQSVSVYMSSAQNFRRPIAEVTAFCDSEAMACKLLLPEVLQRFDATVVLAGDLAMVPEPLAEALTTLEHDCKHRRRHQLNLCVAYDPFQELDDAISMRKQTKCLANYLWIRQPLDLIIRTGDANLISNFLPLQAGFARLYFFEKLFNDFTVDDLRDILDRFAELSRVYGE